MGWHNMTWTIDYSPAKPEEGPGALALYHPEPDASRADWVVEGCYGPLHTLHRIVPEVFEHYVCIRHHGWRWPKGSQSREFSALTLEEQAERMVPARWSEVAEEFGHDAHEAMSWGSIAPPVDYKNPKPGEVAPPLEGEGPLVVFDSVFEVLLSHIGSDQECICAIWEGFGNRELDAIVRAGATRIEGMAQQGHYLMSASLSTIREQWRSVLVNERESCGLVPQAVWPTTKEWFFAVPFEMHASFLGGTAAMTSELQAYEQIDAYPVRGGVRLL